ncbi:hypothetical protein GCM10010403_40710 [Glycomyces rutgersensis]|uniref:Uncharacterized protein n=1 Tax=Glycomyces rutgersensis TaxID=58115 RepID=A0ABP5T438_9ACTN
MSEHVPLVDFDVLVDPVVLVGLCRAVVLADREQLSQPQSVLSVRFVGGGQILFGLRFRQVDALPSRRPAGATEFAQGDRTTSETPATQQITAAVTGGVTARFPRRPIGP